MILAFTALIPEPDTPDVVTGPPSEELAAGGREWREFGTLSATRAQPAVWGTYARPTLTTLAALLGAMGNARLRRVTWVVVRVTGVGRVVFRRRERGSQVAVC